MVASIANYLSLMSHIEQACRPGVRVSNPKVFTLSLCMTFSNNEPSTWRKKSVNDATMWKMNEIVHTACAVFVKRRWLTWKRSKLKGKEEEEGETRLNAAEYQLCELVAKAICWMYTGIWETMKSDAIKYLSFQSAHLVPWHFSPHSLTDEFFFLFYLRFMLLSSNRYGCRDDASRKSSTAWRRCESWRARKFMCRRKSLK